ncbi:discoidin domain-containing receptor 2-like [Argiope bruennichi]|uniref:discoidin domain-containing receptor 2-like n=1 Tax=Argiope bruennichi TaxID=94029 RepID=UPI002494C6F8|nr:discoidin domain-containing receptor 2-like [Argiope bruennichi]
MNASPKLGYRNAFGLFLCLSCVLAFRCCSALDLTECVSALGMESGDIKDHEINASSSYNEGSVGPQNARLDRELNGGAWCPERQISKDVLEYLEVYLPNLHVITAVATQGRFGNGQGREYTEEYMLEYWRPGLSQWKRFTDRKGVQIFKGNTNTYSSVKRIVDPPIIATKIRFVPYSIHLRTICMRVELYGCIFHDGLVSYAMPQGERRGVDVNLSDKIYDGIKDDSYLHGGLGQLTDGQKGDDNFKVDTQGYGKGYEWVGWKNDSGGISTLSNDILTGTESRPIEIIFTFDTVRNFTAVYFYCNNMHSRDVQVFSSAKIWFSVGGRYFQSQAVQFSYMPDLFFEHSRNVTIFLHHGVGRVVKVELHFASRWMLLSEVSFDSVPAVGNFTEEEPPAAPPIVSTALNEDALGNQYVGLVIGVLAAVILLLVVVIFVIIARNKRRKNTSPHNVLRPGENRVTINMKDLGLTFSSCPSHLSNGSVYGQVAADDPDKLLYQEPQDIKANYSGAYCNGTTISREYAIPEIKKAVPPPSSKASSFSRAAGPDRHYAATAVLELPNIQGVSGNTVYAAPNVDEELLPPVPEIPRHKLHYLEKLGEGQFGEVHLCRAEGIPELVDVPCHGNSSTLVAVKSVRPGASAGTKADFFKEVRILSQLRDPNIVYVLGVCTQGEGPLCMIVEYMENGDLNQYLQQHAPETAGTLTFRPSTTSSKTLSYGCLIYMATQIASGMKYLESLNFVHRDLATRNCLVGRNHVIKIADFGMSRSLYSTDYYRIQGRAVLPIRWMAWESILLGKFTTKSDVWAFAVTMWEILTFARHQPYGELTDEQVIENIGFLYHGDKHYRPLPQPPNCPREIYDLMRECWQRNETDRPNFREIHLFLQRKNLGYAPQL